MNSPRIVNLLIGIFILLGLVGGEFALAQDSQEEEKLQNPFGVLEFLHWNDDWNNYKYPAPASVKKSVALMK